MHTTHTHTNAGTNTNTHTFHPKRTAAGGFIRVGSHAGGYQGIYDGGLWGPDPLTLHGNTEELQVELLSASVCKIE